MISLITKGDYMTDIIFHIDRTEKLLNSKQTYYTKILKECENELVAEDVRIRILKLEVKERRLKKLKERLQSKKTVKDSKSLKRIYNSLKKY